MNSADSPDGEESLGVRNNNSIQVNAAKSLCCLAYKNHVYSSSQSIRETVCSPQWVEPEPVDSYIWKVGEPYFSGELSLQFAWSLSSFGCVQSASNVFLPLAACDCPAVWLRISPKSSLLFLISASLCKSQPFNKDPFIYAVASWSL